MSRPLFVASIGNPGANYANTRHSAGHMLLAALAGPQMTMGEPVTVDNMTFWQSPAYMNECGPGLARAWNSFASSYRTTATSDSASPSQQPAPHLVVVHDNMEQLVGRYSTTTKQGGSARGHNGLKSIMGVPQMAETRFTRLAVGIGPRPRSREPWDVAQFVLSNLSRPERDKIGLMARPVRQWLEQVKSQKDL